MLPFRRKSYVVLLKKNYVDRPRPASPKYTLTSLADRDTLQSCEHHRQPSETLSHVFDEPAAQKLSWWEPSLAYPSPFYFSNAAVGLIIARFILVCFVLFRSGL